MNTHAKHRQTKEIQNKIVSWNEIMVIQPQVFM